MPRRIEDISGKKYGMLSGVSYSRHDGYGGQYNFICDCGTACVKALSQVKYGKVLSCGCNQGGRRSHGMTKHPLFDKWRAVYKRCYNPNEKEYKNYGARGIRMCDEWLNDRSRFFEWAMNNGYAPGLQLDRKENDGDYTPENCRFVTPKINSNNKRNNVVLEFNGKAMSIEDWSKEIGIPHQTIRSRRHKGYAIEKVLSPNYIPNGKKNQPKG